MGEKIPNGYIKRLRITVLHWDDQYVYGVVHDVVPTQIVVCYTTANQSVFSLLNQQFYKGAQVNLLSIYYSFDEIRNCVVYNPTYIVLDPDFLLDISTLAACVQYQGSHPLNYFLHKFQPAPHSHHILLGNAANQFMDDCVNHAHEITNDEDISTLYHQSLDKNFRDYLLEYALCADNQIDHSYFEQTKRHFLHVLQTVQDKFESPTIGITREGIRLEPSFFCESLGLQGRMDVLTHDLTRIVELKSGNADRYSGHVVRAKEDHLLQMALYKEVLYYNLDMAHEQVKSFLLYSKYPALFEESASKESIQRAMSLRNGIVYYERILRKGGSRELVNTLSIELFNEKQRNNSFYHNYIQPRIVSTVNTLQNAEGIEADYFHTFLTFLSCEQYAAKVGNGTVGDGVGFADIWRATTDEKIANGSMLIDLQPIITVSSTSAVIDRISLKRPTSDKDFLPNFRKGDVVLFYARNQECSNVTNQQVFRGTIEKIDIQQVTIQLRNKQSYAKLFDENSRYAIEPDYMDSSFAHSYRGLFAFLEANSHRKQLILGTCAPRFEKTYQLTRHIENAQLKEIVSAALRAKDYFLLVGPPGTGKTSIALKMMVEEFLANQQQLLLLAYTNQAVDEICAMLEQVDPSTEYIRLGQELNCNYLYTNRLLKNVTQNLKRRSEVQEKILKTPIFVGTVASFANKSELLKLKHFDVALIDEASQILEPQLLQLLCTQYDCGKSVIPKFILIGDHKQLPAVVVQSTNGDTEISEELRRVGLTSCRNSLFERLIWLNAGTPSVAILTQQGRMHTVISDYVNRYYYHNNLTTVPLSHQKGSLSFIYYSSSKWESFVATTRFGFIEVEHPDLKGNPKMNNKEAVQVAQLLQMIVTLYSKNSVPIELGKNIGIIVPYRNQIAMIQQAIAVLEIKDAEQITIDTVERYQGSQRDVIIFCTTVRNSAQLELLSTPIQSEEVWIDRKLNVALTRARKQLFILGNSELLKESSAYNDLINYIKLSSLEGVAYYNPLE